MRSITDRLFFSLIGAMASCTVSANAVAAPPTKPVASTTAVAATAPKTTNAKALIKSGESKYLAGDYSGALSDFTSADTQKPSAETARYIGLCEDKLGHLAEAISAYQKFVAAPSPELAAQVDPIKARVAEIQATPGKLHVEANPASTLVAIDGSAATQTVPVDLNLPPGHHTLHFSAADHIAKDYELDIVFASSQKMSVTLEDAPVPVVVAPPPAPPPQAPIAPPPPPPPSGLSRQTVAIFAGGLAVVGAGLGAAFGIVALSNKSDFDKNPTYDSGNNAKDFAVYSDAAFGAAAVLAVTSVIFFVTDNNDTPATSPNPSAFKSPSVSPKFSAAPMMTPHGGGASAMVRF